MKNNEGFTIGDKIRSIDGYFFRLNPYNLRVNLSPKNMSFILYFHNVLDKYCEERQHLKKLDEIFFNKVISELIRTNEKLNFITRGWYLYGIEIAKPAIGQSTIIPTIEDLAGFGDFTKDEIISIEKKTIQIADTFDCNSNPFNWERKQYENYNEQVYLSKLDLQEAITKKDVDDINRKLSNLSLSLITTNYDFDAGKLVLLEFIDIAKKVIISNNNKIPNTKMFNKSFNDAWLAFAVVNLYLTANGEDAEKIKMNTSQRILKSVRTADVSNHEFMKNVKSSFNINIKPNSIGKNILSNINQVSL